jgi:NAD(P)H-dependent FMN reductase
MKILAISGSLRTASNNTMLLRAVARLAPDGISVELFRDLGNLPFFNPDIEYTNQPVVARFREQLKAADAVLIASPEYAHGLTGAMKNALDWMVGCEVFVNKPVALLNASPRATHAQASLKETLSMMSASIIEEASIAIPILGSKLDEDGVISHPEISGSLRQMLLTMQRCLPDNCDNGLQSS